MIELDDTTARAELSAIMARLLNPAPLLEAVGQWQEQQIERRIESDKATPDGVPWIEWSIRTAANRRAKGNDEQGLLWDSGALLHSFSFDVAETSVVIGTSGLEYAPWLQDGTAKMPPREFVGWSQDDLLELEFLTKLYVETGNA
jgi:phage gpG-like protein